MGYLLVVPWDLQHPLKKHIVVNVRGIPIYTDKTTKLSP